MFRELLSIFNFDVMHPSPDSPPVLTKALGLLLGLVVAYEATLRLTGVQADYSENNLQANLSRIATYRFEPACENLILGSSLSARLLPEFFANQGMPSKNLALDGAGVPMGLEIVGWQKSGLRRLFLEANSLFFRSPQNEHTIREAMQNPVFAWGQHLFFLRPGSRPSSLLYSWLKKFREDKESGSPGAWPVSGVGQLQSLTENELEQLRQFRREGVELFFVIVPTGVGERNPRADLEPAAKGLGATWIAPRDHLPENGRELRYTDGLHLDRPSAQKISAIIVEMAKSRGGPDSAP